MEPIPRHEVMKQVLTTGGQIFDGFDPQNRNEILLKDLATYPVFDDSGHENRIYSENGDRISRVTALCDEEAQTAGILVRLDSVRDLFHNDSNSGGDGQGDGPSTSVTVYPQSFFGNLGHVKANASISVFQRIIERVNRDILDLGPVDLQHPLNSYSILPITSISSQFYNQLSHRLATRSGTQQVQSGYQTAASAAGYSGFNTSALSKGRRLVAHCSAGLPHTRHFDLLAEIAPGEDTPTDLRAENVFLLDMRAVAPENRTGR